MIKKKTYKFVDLFAGIGGFHLAATNYAKQSNTNFDLVLASEIDEKAKFVYSENFNWPMDKITDIRSIDETKIVDFDILFAGFPCQTFSNAGKKMGFLDETKGTLFFDIERILKAKRPKYFILENVKHLCKHDGGNTYRVITDHLKDLNYAINEEPLIINSYAFDVPQNRERLYILGINKETGFAHENIDITQLQNEINNNYTKNTKRDLIVETSFYDSSIPGYYFLNSTKNRSKDDDLNFVFEAWNNFIKLVEPEKNRTLPVIWVDAFSMTNTERTKIENDPFIPDWKKKYYRDIFAIYDNNKEIIDDWLGRYDVKNWSRKRNRKFEWQTGLTDRDSMKLEDGFVQLRQSGIRVRKKMMFPTLVAIVQTSLIFDKNQGKWRYLTTNETKKLQTFEFRDKFGRDSVTKSFRSYDELLGDSVPHTNRYTSYKQFGNAVTVKVIEKLIEFLLEEVK